MRKLSVPRRAFLGGAAVAIALPFFESLTPREARGQAAAAPKRFLGVFMPNGFDMADFRPIGGPGALQLGPMMASLAPFKDQLLVLGGLQNTHQDHSTGDHAGGIGAMLTSRSVKFDSEKMGGASIDQVIAEQVGGGSRLKSLELAGEAGATEGACDSYRCSIGNHISFDASGTPLPKLFDTGQVFDRLFQGFDPSASAVDVARRNQSRKSVLDAVLAQAQDLKTKLNAGDNVKLDEYLNAVREVETRIGLGSSAGSCTPPIKKEGSLTDQQRHEVLNDLVSLAFQCDITRVSTLMWGNFGSNRNYAAAGAAGGHHDLSHHGTNQSSLDKLKMIGKWEMDRLADLLGKLKALPDSDGRTVLDNTLIFYSSDVSDGDAHNHDDMPVLLAGGGANFAMNRYLTYPDEPYFGELFLSIANAYGSTMTSFGEHGDKPLPGLNA